MISSFLVPDAWALLHAFFTPGHILISGYRSDIMVNQFLKFMNNLAGFTKFLEWVTSVVIFVIVYVIYRHLENKLKWTVDYFPTRDGILLKILNRSGEEAVSFIKLKQILYKNSNGKIYKIDAKFFPGILDELPTVINDSHRIVNIPIKNEEIDNALDDVFKNNQPKLKDGYIIGKLILYFSDGHKVRCVSIRGRASA